MNSKVKMENLDEARRLFREMEEQIDRVESYLWLSGESKLDDQIIQDVTSNNVLEILKGEKEKLGQLISRRQQEILAKEQTTIKQASKDNEWFILLDRIDKVAVREPVKTAPLDWIKSFVNPSKPEILKDKGLEQELGFINSMRDRLLKEKVKPSPNFVDEWIRIKHLEREQKALVEKKIPDFSVESMRKEFLSDIKSLGLNEKEWGEVFDKKVRDAKFQLSYVDRLLQDENLNEAKLSEIKEIFITINRLQSESAGVVNLDEEGRKKLAELRDKYSQALQALIIKANLLKAAQDVLDTSEDRINQLDEDIKGLISGISVLTQDQIDAGMLNEKQERLDELKDESARLKARLELMPDVLEKFPQKWLAQQRKLHDLERLKLSQIETKPFDLEGAKTKFSDVLLELYPEGTEDREEKIQEMLERFESVLKSESRSIRNPELRSFYQ